VLLELADYVESSVPGVARRHFPWPERERQPKPAPGENADPFERLPETLELIELMIEQCSRFEGYLAELRAMRDSGMAFQQWQGMAPAESRGTLGLFYSTSSSPGRPPEASTPAQERLEAGRPSASGRTRHVH
jgi:hypothetical protein